jgi:hypothetical protein
MLAAQEASAVKYSLAQAALSAAELLDQAHRVPGEAEEVAAAAPLKAVVWEVQVDHMGQAGVVVGQAAMLEDPALRV